MEKETETRITKEKIVNERGIATLIVEKENEMKRRSVGEKCTRKTLARAKKNRAQANLLRLLDHRRNLVNHTMTTEKAMGDHHLLPVHLLRRLVVLLRRTKFGVSMFPPDPVFM